jgi:hypothetical protein
MPLESTIRYKDAKKHPSNRSDVKKKNTTHEERCNYYNRFLKPVKETLDAVMKGATVVLATQAVLGLDRAHALSTSDAPSTALVSPDGGSRDNNNVTALHLDQKRLPHLSNQTHLEHSLGLGKMTPEQLKQMGVKNPERFLENVQKLEQNLQQRVQKRVQRQEMRRIVEEAQKNPEVLKSLRKLFEEMPGKEDSETDRRKLDVVSGKPCMQWGFINTVKGVPTAVEGGGSAITVNYDTYVINTCSEPISNIQFTSGEYYTCPAGCAETSDTKTYEMAGLPSSIGQGGMSTGTGTDALACKRVDASGAITPMAPTKVVATVLPQGMQGGKEVYAGAKTFDVYP